MACQKMYNQFTSFNNTAEKASFQQKSNITSALSFPLQKRKGFALFCTLVLWCNARYFDRNISLLH